MQADHSSQQLRQRLIAFYARHNPVRLQTLDAIIDSWGDDEEGLFEALKEKYALDDNFEPIQNHNNNNNNNNNDDHHHSVGSRSESSATIAESYWTTGESVNLKNNSSPNGPKGRVEEVTVGADSLDPITAAEYAPAHMGPQEQLEYRYQKMERYLTDLYTAPYDPRHEGTVADFRDAAAAFSEVCLGIVRNSKAAARRLAEWEKKLGAAAAAVGREEGGEQRGGAVAARGPSSASHAAGSSSSSGGGYGIVLGKGGVVTGDGPAVVSMEEVRRSGGALRVVSDTNNSNNNNSANKSGGVLALPSAAANPFDTDTSFLVHDVMPLASGGIADHVISSIIESKCHTGDVLNLHPGVYKDNIVIGGSNVRVHLKASASASRDRPVILVSNDPTVPALQVRDGASVVLLGIGLSGTTDASAQAVPIVTVDSGASVAASDCTFLGGGGGLMLGGKGTWAALRDCSLKECVFAGVYVRSGAHLAMRRTLTQRCEVGVRVRDATVEAEGCEFTDSASDGLTFHGESKGSVVKSSLSNNKENGAMLSPSSAVAFSACTLVGNGQFGIYVPSGAEYSADTCVFTANSMGTYNRPPPLPRGSAVGRGGL